jgi:hypothetical protein
VSTGKVFLYIFYFIPLILHCPHHYVSAPSTGKIFAFSFFVFCTLVIRNATSPPPDQPFTMPSVFPDTDWACEACTHPNKGGNTCVTCQTPHPRLRGGCLVSVTHRTTRIRRSSCAGCEASNAICSPRNHCWRWACCTSTNWITRGPSRR